jgi:uncharacterized protein YhdP
VRDWLRTAIKQGVATDIRTSLSGDLADFPFTDAKKGQFLVTFKATNALLDYAKGWPEITDIDGDVRFEGPSMAINVRTARVLGVELGTVRQLVRRGRLARSGGTPRQAWYAAHDVAALAAERQARNAA